MVTVEAPEGYAGGLIEADDERGGVEGKADIFENNVSALNAIPHNEIISAEEILSRVKLAKLGMLSDTETVSIKNIIGFKDITDEMKKEVAKALIEKHSTESAELEDQLHANETKEILSVLNDVQKKEKEAIQEIQNELKV